MLLPSKRPTSCNSGTDRNYDTYLAMFVYFGATCLGFPMADLNKYDLFRSPEIANMFDSEECNLAINHVCKAHVLAAKLFPSRP